MVRSIRCFIFIVFIVMLGGPRVYAAGTLANTTISNTATANFKVGTVDQTPVTSSPATFVVDRKVTFTVSAQDTTYVPVGPTATTSQALKFTIKNDSNDVMDFKLAFNQDAGSGDPFGGGGSTDTFDTVNVKLFKDNGDGNFTSADTLVTFLDEVGADASVTVFVVSDMPTPLPANGNIASGTLTATAEVGGAAGEGALHTETLGPDSSSVVDTVFADAAGDTDIARDGKHSDDSAYKVFTPTLTATKIFTVISDFVNSTNPKAIPGAVVEYCIQIKNNGDAQADNVIITDTVPTGSTFISGSIVVVGGTNSGTTCTDSGTPEDDDASGSDDTLLASENTGSFSGGVVTTTVFALPKGNTTASRFRVTINP